MAPASSIIKSDAFPAQSVDAPSGSYSLLSQLRVRELGCAAGDTLATLAAANPSARFVGIDISAQEIASAERLVRRVLLYIVPSTGAAPDPLKPQPGDDVTKPYGLLDGAPKPALGAANAMRPSAAENNVLLRVTLSI